MSRCDGCREELIGDEAGRVDFVQCDSASPEMFVCIYQAQWEVLSKSRGRAELKGAVLLLSLRVDIRWVSVLVPDLIGAAAVFTDA